jgi:hypothetical protein
MLDYNKRKLDQNRLMRAMERNAYQDLLNADDSI